MYWHYTKGAGHSQWPKVPWVISPPSTFQYHKDPCCSQQSCFLQQTHINGNPPSLSSHVFNLLLTALSAPTTTSTTSTRLVPRNFLVSLFRSWYFKLFTLLFINSVIPWWSNIHNNCFVTIFLNNNNVRSSGLNNIVTLDGHVPQYVTSFIFLLSPCSWCSYHFSLLFKLYLLLLLLLLLLLSSLLLLLLHNDY